MKIRLTEIQYILNLDARIWAGERKFGLLESLDRQRQLSEPEERPDWPPGSLNLSARKTFREIDS